MIAACPLPRSFLGTTPRRVEVDVLAGVTAASTRSTAVNLTGFVIDVSTLASFRRDVATIGRFVGTGVMSTVAVLQMALCRMVGAVVLVAGVAFALSEAVRGSIRVAGFDAHVVDGLGCVAVGHFDLLRSAMSNARAEAAGTGNANLKRAGSKPTKCGG